MEPSVAIAEHQVEAGRVVAELSAILHAAAIDHDAERVRAVISNARAVADAMRRLADAALTIQAAMPVGQFPELVRRFDDLARMTRRRPRRPLPPGLSKQLHESLVGARDAMAQYVRDLEFHASRFEPLLPGTYDNSNLNELFARWATPNN